MQTEILNMDEQGLSISHKGKTYEVKCDDNLGLFVLYNGDECAAEETMEVTMAITGALAMLGGVPMEGLH